MFDYSNIDVICKNTLAPRSYFLPYKAVEDALKDENRSILLLNGEWDFAYFPSVLDVKNIADVVYSHKIEVPSCWQYQGFEKPIYVNDSFLFPFDPPHLPLSTPIGVYRKKIHICKEDDTYILTFLGSHASTIYVNNQEVGYFEGTHNLHEFDISPYLVNGENIITIVVYKWCNGSYLEAQDMFRDTGIFRDVYIAIVPKTYIFDYQVTTKKLDKNTYSFSCEVFLSSKENNCQVALSLLDKNHQVIYSEDGKTTFTKELNVSEWSSETPTLYTLVLTLKENENVLEVVKDFVGFKTVDISNGIFKINDKPIMIKGVNYHESTPDKGFTVDYDTFLKDIKIIKSLNINTIRFSHYPTHPYMLELCEQYGLYVIDEADIETYGCLSTSDKDFVSKNEMFRTRFLDRAEHLYMRDKNSPAIIMWSVGNESGIGENLDLAYDYLTSKNTGLPIQYETCFRGDYDEFYKGKSQRGYDVISIMYPTLETLKYYDEKEDKRPFYLCEFMHSMGLGPGGMKEIWEVLEKTPRFFGGCVWEYCDHACIENLGEEDISKRKYLYGGDNNEFIHDGNFCLDGIVLPDRRLSTSAYEVKNIYRPFVFSYQNGEIFIRNTNSFVSAENYTFLLKVLKNGVLQSETELKSNVLPLEEKFFYSYKAPNDGEYSVVIETLQNGEVCGIDNFVFGKYENKIEEKPIQIEDKNHIATKNYQAKFDERTRTLSSFVVNGKEIFAKNPQNYGYGEYDKNKVGFLPNIFRAPTDNDRPRKDEWLNHLYDKMWVSFFEMEDDKNKFAQKGTFSPGKFEKMFDISSSYEFLEDGIKIGFEIKATREFRALPKFGVRFQIDKTFHNICYYGLGPRENYPDLKSASYLGVFKGDLQDFNEDYIKPQENGARGNVRYVRFLNDNGNGFEIETIDKPFSFSAHDYSLEDLTTAKHNFELPKRDFIEVSIDGFMRGIGSASCGPEPTKDYELNLSKDEKLSFCFLLKGLKND